MRILYVPTYTSSDLEACSTYQFTSEFFKQWLEEDENIHIYLPVYDPEHHGIEHPRVTKIKIDYERYKSQRARMREVPDNLIQLFKDEGGQYFADTIVCDSPMVTTYLQNRIPSYTSTGSGGYLFVNLVQFVLDKEHSTFLNPEGFYLYSMGLASADFNFVSLPTDKKRLLREAKKWLSPTLVRRIEKNTFTGLGGIDSSKVCNRDLSKSDQFIFNWGTALNSGYNVDKIFEELDLFFKSGRDFRVVCSSGNTKSTLVDWEKYSYFEIRDNVPQEEFWNNCAKCHAFIYDPAGASELSYSVLEQQSLGLIGIFSDIPVNRDMVYPGYPFIVKTHDELMATLRMVYTNYHSDEINEVRERQKQYIAENFQINKRNKKIYSLLRDQYHSVIKSRESKLTDFVVLFSEFPEDHLTLDEWVSLTKERSRNNINVLDHRGRFGSGKSVYRRAMQIAGYKDDCTESQPVFLRSVK